MATSLAVSLSLTLKTNYTTTDVDLSTPADVMTKSIVDSLANGKGLDKAESVYHDSLVTGVGGTTLDVFGGLSDTFGNVLSMDQIKCILVHNTSTTTGEYVLVGNSAAEGINFGAVTADQVRVNPGGIFLWYSPGADADNATAAAATDDELLFTAGAGTPTVDIVIIGENN